MITRRKLLLAVPALILPKPANAWLHHGSAANGLIINLVPTAAFLAAPAAFQSAVQTAANMHMAQWTNTPITINIQVGYDEFGASGTLSETLASAGKFVVYPTYRSLMQTLAALSGNATMISATGAYPAGSTIGGFGSVQLVRAEMKILGLSPDVGNQPVSPRDSVIDAQMGMGSATPLSTLVGAALYEINHAMGGPIVTGKLNA